MKEPNVIGIILAAGFSRRMPCEKLLLPIDGLPMIEHVLKAATASTLKDVMLIYQNLHVAEIGERYNVRCIYNERAIHGQSESIKLGIVSALPEIDAYMFLVGDQPFIQAGFINRIIAGHSKHPEHIIVPCYGGKRATPVLFPESMRGDLLELQGDSGGRQIMARDPDLIHEITIKEELGGVDIDTPETYQHLKGR